MLALPVNFHKTPARYQRPAPQLGEHTEEVLREFGFSQPEIEKLAKDNVIAAMDD